MVNKQFWEGKKVLITGHTGFKGSWLVSWLYMLGAKVTGISLDPTEKYYHYKYLKNKIKIKDIRLDIRNENKLKNQILKIQPDFVFHLAAQSIVSTSYLKPKYTFETNVVGSFNLLNSLNKLKKNVLLLW